MAHTPGPWSADYGDFAAYCATGAEVCEVTRGKHDDGSRIPDDEMEANLNLVAAAPELLRELKFAVRVLQDNHIARGVAAALAAIRLAEGGNR